MAASDAHDILPHYRTLTEFPDSPSVYDSPYAHSTDDETTSTIRSHLHDDPDLDDCTDNASRCISLQGPRIRFHSRAPWETDSEDVMPRAEEPNKSATIGSKLRGKASRADTLMRTLTKGSFITGRPSIDSARSQVSATSSFEFTGGNYSSSRGALYDLAKESMSTVSLSSTTTSASVRQQTFARTTNHPKPSLYFTHTHGSLPLDSMDHSPVTFESTSMLPSSSDPSPTAQEPSTSPSSSQERQSRDEFVHPYANPDLVVPYTPPPETIPSHHLTSGDMSGSDSNSTVADSTSIRSAAFSVISTKTSASSDFPYGHPRVNGKEISSPIAVLHQSDTTYVDRNTRFLSLHPPPAGFDSPPWTNLRSPAVTLITLQEAQARERVRSNTTHATAVRPKLPPPNVDDIPEKMDNQAVQMESRTRARSTSAGIGTRHPLPPAQTSEIGEDSTSMSAVSGRTLKHKKSGFMRLFTSRNSDAEKEKSPPPSIPPLVDAYIKQSLQIHGTGKISKPTLPGVPKPSFSPTLQHTTNIALASTSGSSGGDGPDGKGPSARRRQPPSLSIITKTSDRSISSSATGGSFSTGLDFTPPSLTVPQSAPPGDSDFRGLKLRPVSASFSSHFADIVAATMDARQDEVHTPSSAASSCAAPSPFTPVSVRRSEDASATAVEMAGEEHLTIRGLQDQFSSAKKAWQQQIWELRGQIRDLTSELEGLRAVENQEYCDACGRGKPQRHHASPSEEHQPTKIGVVNRPRARTGDTARFASGN